LLVLICVTIEKQAQEPLKITQESYFQ